MTQHDISAKVLDTAEHMLGKESVEIETVQSASRVEEIEETPRDAYDPAVKKEYQTTTTEQRPELARTISASSALVAVVKVPTSERAGLLARLSLLYEAEEPKHYPRNIKWFITFEIALAAVAAPMGSSIILRKHPSRTHARAAVT